MKLAWMLIGFLAISTESNDVNLALNKPARQSSTLNQDNVAGKAVNGLMSDFSHTLATPTKWWTVDLGTLYDIQLIELYNRQGYYLRLAQITVLTGTGNSTPDPSLTDTRWITISYQEDPYGSVGTVILSPPVRARHVAVFSAAAADTGELPLTLVEVKIYMPTQPQLGDLSGRVDVQELTSLTISFDQWNHEMTGTVPPTEYRVSRSGDSNVQTIHHSISNSTVRVSGVQWTGLTPGQDYTITVSCRIEGTACPGNRYTFPARARSCTAPTSPRNLAVAQGSLENVNERMRWKYTATWSAPTQMNCDAVSYQYGRNGSVTSPDITVALQVFYLEGDQTYNFILLTKNRAASSNTVSLSGRSPEIAPQFKPTEVTLVAESSTAVRLSWRPPQYPGGTITRYQHKCGSYPWTNVGRTRRTTIIGGFPVYTDVTCEIKAINNAGQSEAETKVIKTACGVPERASNLRLPSVNVLHFGRRRWRYTVTWQQPSRNNCFGGVTYQFRLTKGSTTSAQTANSGVTFNIDGNQFFIVSVEAENSVGFSAPITMSGTSNYLAPQFKPREVTLVAESSTAVRLRWRPPQYPGGTITYYQHKCGSYPWTNVGGTLRTAVIGGFPVYTDVTCEIKAINNAGQSEVERKVNKTGCGVPERASNFRLSPMIVLNSGRRRWRYTVTWQQPSRNNCFGVVAYQFRITKGSTTSEQTANSGVTFYIDGNQFFNVSVAAGNSVGFSASITISGTSNYLAPQFMPREVTLVAESSTAVRLSWRPPQYPGGTITRYEHQCGRYPWTNVGGTLRTAVIGGFPVYTNVTCEIKAINSEGESTVERKVNKTGCGEPEFLAEISYNETYQSSTEKRVIRFNSVPVHEIDLNCASLWLLEYKVDNVPFRRNKEFGNLRALTNYTAAVKATNNARHFSTKTLIIQTGELKPYDAPYVEYSGPTNVSCVTARWSKPSIPNGIITKYEFRCAEASEEFSSWTSTGLVPSFVHCGYSAGNIVKCQIRAHTKIGAGPANQTEVKVNCVNPTEPEFEVNSSAGFVNGTESVTILLDLKPSIHNCQSLLHYIVVISTKDDGLNTTHSSTIDQDGMLSFTDYDAYTEYNISVEAVNNNNLSSTTVESHTTVEIAPQSEPKSLILEPNTNCVALTATGPMKPNGLIIKYQFTCAQKTFSTNATVNASLEGNKGFANLCGLKSASFVNCSAVAFNSAGESPVQKSSGYTQLKVIDVANSKPVLKRYRKGSPTVPVTIKPMEVKHVDPSYYIVLMERQSLNDRQKRTTAGQCDEESVQHSYEEAQRIGRGCYATAKLTAEEVGKEYTLNVGDGETYGGFLNQALDSGITYFLRIAVQVDIEGEAKPLITIIDEPIKVLRTDIPAGEIAGGVIGGLVAAAAVCAVLFFVKRRQQQIQKKKESGHRLTNLSTLQDTDNGNGRIESIPAVHPRAVVLPGENSDGEENDDIYGNMVDVESEAVPIERLEWYKNTNPEVIKEQYRRLELSPKPVMNLAFLPENKGKCRYKNLYPSDKHRVVLHRPEGSDYINASHIMGYKKRKTYIAAQGPIRNTIDDFWFMLWQERPSVIIMVTRAIENCKTKCEQYWPLDVGDEMKFKDIYVTLTSTETWTDFVMSKLKITKDGESRSLMHFNYLSWPDHGVPENTGSFISFHNKILAETGHFTGPPMVHCSAGVGRTGTYIALEYLLGQAKEEGLVDAYACVKKMRARRPAMIQTVDQYEFLHEALHEATATRYFRCTPLELSSKLDLHHSALDSESDIVTLEYQHIEKRIKSLSPEYTTAKLDQNARKNRYSEILPCEAHIPFLINGADGKYINAVLVDAYRERDKWIATQLPLSTTIGDFWQLMIEKDVTVVVQLQATSTPFYPMKDATSMPFESHTISREYSTDTDYFKIVSLKIKTGNMNFKYISVLLVKRWSSNSGDLPSPSAIVSLQGELERLQQKTENGKICVTCLDGSARCGLLICAYNALEKLKVEQQVDIYNPTMAARLCRPQFVPTMEQYELLYEVMREYAESFSEYANFK